MNGVVCSGMPAVCESEHFGECIKARPSNRERLLKTDAGHFIAVMSHWRDCFLQSANLPIVGATEADLGAIKAPACLIAGNDVIHTPATARKAAALIPGSELHDDVVEKHEHDGLTTFQASWAALTETLAQKLAAAKRGGTGEKDPP